MRKRVLFLTGSEFGQAQVSFAIIHELLGHDDVEVHLASFGELRNRLAELEALASSHYGSEKTVEFHELAGPAMLKAFVLNQKEINALCHGPGVKNAIKAYNFVPNIISAWDPPDYMTIFRSAVQTIRRVTPTYVVVDAQFSPSIEAARISMPDRCILVSPISLNQQIPVQQPWGAFFWKYPA
jgi:hypothetical protein